MKETHAYKSVLSPWKKGDTEHKGSFTGLRARSGGSEPHSGEREEVTKPTRQKTVTSVMSTTHGML